MSHDKDSNEELRESRLEQEEERQSERDGYPEPGGSGSQDERRKHGLPSRDHTDDRARDDD